MPWQDAIQATPDGCRILIDATPGAHDARFPDGYDSWRGRIGARTTAPAQGGKANKDLARLVAATLGVPERTVAVTEGQKDRRKTIQVHGLDAPEAQALLAPAMSETP